MVFDHSYPPMATATLVPFNDGTPIATPAIPLTQQGSLPTTKTHNGAATEDIHQSPALLSIKSQPLNENQIQKLLDQGYTRGLAASLNQMRDVYALRFWIIDNSGSMQKTDGHRMVPTKNREVVKMVECSRWEEISQCVDYHIQLAGLIGAPTRFRFLNNPGANVGPQQFSVAENPERSMYDVQEATKIMRGARPSGCTPLTSHILKIHQEVSQMTPELCRLGKKVVIIIATDGLPTDERGVGGHRQNQEFVESLRCLEGLPVWVVVRLCTDEEDVVGFYNDLDGQLELSLEVLDDFEGEAAEITGENPWLTYALPLHRLREMGYHDRVFDMLDERPLTRTEVRDFCALLFGEQHFDGVPDPSLDWKEFKSYVERMLRRESLQFDPIKRRLKKWISVKRLNRIYGDKGYFSFLK